MGMPDLVRVWTRDEVLALPDDGNRYELVDGELLVSPSPRPLHQLAVAAFYREIDGYLRRHRLGVALFSPADLDLNDDQLLQPDVFVVPESTDRPFREWAQVGVPSLVVEVLSASTARNDRVTKRRRYQGSGVPAYWVVDLDARVVEVWTPAATAPVIAIESLTWQPDGATPPLVVDLPGVFRQIWSD